VCFFEWLNVFIFIVDFLSKKIERFTYLTMGIFCIIKANFSSFSTVNVLIPPIRVCLCSFADSAGHRHFFISLHILYVYVTIKHLESCIPIILSDWWKGACIHQHYNGSIPSSPPTLPANTLALTSAGFSFSANAAASASSSRFTGDK